MRLIRTFRERDNAMRSLVLLGWLMVPVAFGAYHYGPGQEKLRLDDVGRALPEADRLAAKEDWSEWDSTAGDGLHEP